MVRAIELGSVPHLCNYDICDRMGSAVEGFLHFKVVCGKISIDTFIISLSISLTHRNSHPVDYFKIVKVLNGIAYAKIRVLYLAS